jgi:hypothetical protein
LRHRNDAADRTRCQKQLRFGALEPEECCRRIKAWLLEGFSIDPSDPDARLAHLHIDPRTLPDMTDEELDLQLGLLIGA